MLSEAQEVELEIDDSDLDWKTSRGSGPGGQHRNKTDTCVVLTHIPSGISVRCDSKSQKQNKRDALRILKERLVEEKSNKQSRKRNKKRQIQVGTGMRGDKVRTIRCQDDTVKCHQTGKKMRLKKYLRGELP